MTQRSSKLHRDNTEKIRERRDSMSPSRDRKANEFRERSRDRSVDRSSIVSNGTPNRTKDSSKTQQNSISNGGNEQEPSRDQDERGRNNDRKADTTNTNDDDDQQAMLQLMGFGAFDSTKGKHVAGVGSGGAKKNKKAQFRQYMNRDKGFNRNLSPERTRKR